VNAASWTGVSTLKKGNLDFSSWNLKISLDHLQLPDVDAQMDSMEYSIVITQLQMMIVPSASTIPFCSMDPSPIWVSMLHGAVTKAAAEFATATPQEPAMHQRFNFFR
jgi:hypothetical protein